jgi:accessory colonization factor AcfC
MLLDEISRGCRADVICCGAEYILDEATEGGLIVGDSRRSLGLRRSAIIVPMGNPGNVKTLGDLCKEGMRVGIAVEGCLKGIWDDVASRAGLTDQIRRNIVYRADSCGSAMALVNTLKADAIFGWSAFAKLWPKTSEAVELPEEFQVFRSTVISVVRGSKNRQGAQELIAFLASAEADDFYTALGWIRKR